MAAVETTAAATQTHAASRATAPPLARGEKPNPEPLVGQEEGDEDPDYHEGASHPHDVPPRVPRHLEPRVVHLIDPQKREVVGVLPLPVELGVALEQPELGGRLPGL